MHEPPPINLNQQRSISQTLISHPLISLRVSTSITVTGDRLEDLVGGLGPGEGARVFVAVRQPVADVGAQLAYRAVGAAAQLARGQLGEPALDEVQPGGAGGGEVQREARMGEQPAPHRRGLVGGVCLLYTSPSPRD